MTVATFTLRFRFVRLFSQRKSLRIQHVGRGLQIREGGFDSPTRLQYLADLARGFSTCFSTFPVCSGFVPAVMAAIDKAVRDAAERDDEVKEGQRHE